MIAATVLRRALENPRPLSKDTATKPAVRSAVAGAVLSLERVQIGDPEHPIPWMERVLRIPRRTIVWSEYPEYRNHVWDGTKDPHAVVADALWRWVKRISIESATGTNKTYQAAALVLWFLGNYRNSLVRTFGPKAEQLSINLWKEIGGMWALFKASYPTAHLTRDLTIYMKRGANEKKWAAHGLSAAIRSGETSNVGSQGAHAEHMLHFIEEGPGVDYSIIEAVINTSGAPHNLTVVQGNPDNQHDSLHRFATSSGCLAVRISALDHPNIVCKNDHLIPGATTQEQIDTARADYGEDSPFFLSRRRGISPADAADALIKKSWLEEAVPRKLALLDRYRLERRAVAQARGVDVADGGGDSAAISRWLGEVCYEVQPIRVGEGQMVRDATQLGTYVFNECVSQGVAASFVGVDSVGNGAATVGKLREKGREPQLLGGGNSPVFIPEQVEQFDNLRSQMYWQAREDLRKGVIGIPDDKELWFELQAHTWQMRGNLICVEQKVKVKERIHRSPDRADAFVYGNWVRQRRTGSAGAMLVTH